MEVSIFHLPVLRIPSDAVDCLPDMNAARATIGYVDLGVTAIARRKLPLDLNKTWLDDPSQPSQSTKFWTAFCKAMQGVRQQIHPFSRDRTSSHGFKGLRSPTLSVMRGLLCVGRID